MEYEIIEVEPLPKTGKITTTVESMDGAYRGSLYTHSITRPKIADLCAPKEPPREDTGYRKVQPTPVNRKIYGRKRSRPRDYAPTLAISDGVERINESYGARIVILSRMGFMSYAEYCESKLWKSIKDRVFKEKGANCVLCRRKAKNVHHHSYAEDVLDGSNIAPLFPMCRLCHDRLEHGRNGEKLKLKTVQLKFQKIYRKRNGTYMTNAASIGKQQPEKPKKTRRRFPKKPPVVITDPQSRAKILAELRSRKQKTLDNPVTPNTVQSAGQ